MYCPTMRLPAMPMQRKPKPVANEIDKVKEKQARDNHCEIERKRRIKMAGYFNELCALVPSSIDSQKKPDKLNILKNATSHMMTLRGPQLASSDDSTYKPSFLSDQELKYLILEAANGFLFVAQSDTANIIYVSNTVQPVLCYSEDDWFNQSLFNFIHADDLEKVKEQLSSQELNITNRVIDLKTGTVKKDNHSTHMGNRRSFVCRIRIGSNPIQEEQQQQQQQSQQFYQQQNNFGQINRLNIHSNSLGDKNTNTDGNNYAVVHISGYIKSCAPINAMQIDGNGNNQFYLVAIARIQETCLSNDSTKTSNIEFYTRIDPDGIITHSDHKLSEALGYQVSDVLKKSIYDLCAPEDLNSLQELIKKVHNLKIKEWTSINHRLKSVNQENLAFETSSYAFLNPFNEQFEFILCKHRLLENSNLLKNPATSTFTPQQSLVSNNQLNTNSTITNYVPQANDPTQQNQIYPSYIPPINQEIPQNLYNNQQLINIDQQNLTTTSLPLSTTSQSNLQSFTAAPAVNSIYQQSNIQQQQQQQQPLFSTNTNLKWPNYSQPLPSSNLTSTNLNNQTTQYLHPTQPQYSTDTNIYQTSAYNNENWTNNSDNFWQMQTAPIQQNFDLFTQNYQQQPTLALNQTIENDQFNCELMNM